LLRGPAEELVEMRDVASTKHDNGIKVQQLDPDLMVRSILSCGKVWQSYYQRQGNKVPSDVTDEDSREERRQDGASGSRDRKAGAGKRPNPNPNPRDRKRPNPPGTARPAPPTDRGSFDPFTRYGSLVTASRTDSNVRPWVKNMTSQKSAALRAEKKCIFCEKVGHFSDMCPDREGMFRAKKACFHPAK
jgi:hypothetical protein